MRKCSGKLPRFVTLLCFMGGVLGADAADVSLSTDLVAYYPFDGGADDFSGRTNHGTVHGAMLTTDRFGRAASAYYFNGSSSYIEMERPLPDFSSGSFSAWITARRRFRAEREPLSNGRLFCISHSAPSKI